MIPVIHEVDVVVAGGACAAVAAAAAAARAGSSVFLAARRSYLGDDVAGTLAILDDDFTLPAEPTPFNAKKILDEMLLDAGVRFMTGCYATELLVDDDGKPAGIVIANRSGRQAIKSKVVIDATPHGILARQAGAPFTEFKPGPVKVSIVVITDEPPEAPGMTVRQIMEPRTVNIGGKWGVKPADGGPDEILVTGYRCEATLQLEDCTPFALAELEHRIRDLVFTYGQQDIAEIVEMPPLFRLAGGLESGKSCLDRLEGIYSPGSFACGQLANPIEGMRAGEAVGAAAAHEASRRSMSRGVHVQGGLSQNNAKPVYGEVRELLDGLMPNATRASGSVADDNVAPLTVFGKCDVLVAGGGSSGSPAAIAAAREGMDVVLCEYHHDLGGTSTVGVLGKYYPSEVASRGFSAEMDPPIGAMAANINQGKAEWFRRTGRKHGVRILTGTLVCGLTVQEGRVTGAVVAFPDGRRGVILAKTVVDATGNADLAAACGEPTQFIGDAELAIQGASKNDRLLGSNTVNVDIGFVDDTDAWDTSFFSLRTRRTLALNSTWDQSQHVDSRERRRIVGAYTVKAADVLAGRRFHDTVVQGMAPLDNHGQTTDPMLALFCPTPELLELNFPYRMMLPSGIDGLLVTGLGISADHDAIAAMRMQRDLQNLGYAAGLAAAMSIKDGIVPRSINVRELQSKLVEIGILDPDAATWCDSFPLPHAELEAAVLRIPDRGPNGMSGYKGLAELHSDPRTAVELLKQAYEAADNSEARVMYAASLAVFGDASGISTLIEAVRGAPAWDDGWQWSGPGAYARKHSFLDGCILMLGRLRARKALPAIEEKAALLTGLSEFSHFRAVAMALEQIGEPAAAQVLAALLKLPGVRGNNLQPFSTSGVLPYKAYDTEAGDAERCAVLRELAIARALFRLCDVSGQGEAVLRSFVADPRSAYARHALSVLDGESG